MQGGVGASSSSKTTSRDYPTLQLSNEIKENLLDLAVIVLRKNPMLALATQLRGD